MSAESKRDFLVLKMFTEGEHIYPQRNRALLTSGVVLFRPQNGNHNHVVHLCAFVKRKAIKFSMATMQALFILMDGLCPNSRFTKTMKR